MGGTGIYHIVVAKDRARQEFSNATALLELSRQQQWRQIPFVLEVEGHGKGHVDGLGAGVKRMIQNNCQRSSEIPSIPQIADFLKAYTNSKPICGDKCRKYIQYHVMADDPRQIQSVTCRKTAPHTSGFYMYQSTGTGSCDGALLHVSAGAACRTSLLTAAICS